MNIAFDFDGVIVDNTAQKVMDCYGRKEFTQYEQENAHVLLPKGPLWDFYVACVTGKVHCRTAIVTARGLKELGRVFYCLDQWRLPLPHDLVNTDQELKGPYLKRLKVDLFFDDVERHIISAREHGILSFKVG